MEEQIAKMMKALDITREEAIELINEDKEIDRKKMSDIDDDLTTDQKKSKKKYTTVKRGVNAYGKKTERVLKPDENKRMIISLLAQALENSGQITKVNIDNPQKYITFSIESEDFKIDLIRKRKTKE
jgi:spore germination cell wall hydrolase CwlJ-like protein